MIIKLPIYLVAAGLATFFQSTALAAPLDGAPNQQRDKVNVNGVGASFFGKTGGVPVLRSNEPSERDNVNINGVSASFFGKTGGVPVLRSNERSQVDTIVPRFDYIGGPGVGAHVIKPPGHQRRAADDESGTLQARWGWGGGPGIGLGGASLSDHALVKPQERDVNPDDGHNVLKARLNGIPGSGGPGIPPKRPPKPHQRDANADDDTSANHARELPINRSPPGGPGKRDESEVNVLEQRIVHHHPGHPGKPGTGEVQETDIDNDVLESRQKSNNNHSKKPGNPGGHGKRTKADVDVLEMRDVNTGPEHPGGHNGPGTPGGHGKRSFDGHDASVLEKRDFDPYKPIDPYRPVNLGKPPRGEQDAHHGQDRLTPRFGRNGGQVVGGGSYEKTASQRRNDNVIAARFGFIGGPTVSPGSVASGDSAHGHEDGLVARFGHHGGVGVAPIPGGPGQRRDHHDDERLVARFGGGGGVGIGPIPPGNPGQRRGLKDDDRLTERFGSGGGSGIGGSPNPPGPHGRRSEDGPLVPRFSKLGAPGVGADSRTHHGRDVDDHEVLASRFGTGGGPGIGDHPKPPPGKGRRGLEDAPFDTRDDGAEDSVHRWPHKPVHKKHPPRGEGESKRDNSSGNNNNNNSKPPKQGRPHGRSEEDEASHLVARFGATGGPGVGASAVIYLGHQQAVQDSLINRRGGGNEQTRPGGGNTHDPAHHKGVHRRDEEDVYVAKRGVETIPKGPPPPPHKENPGHQRDTDEVENVPRGDHDHGQPEPHKHTGPHQRGNNDPSQGEHNGGGSHHGRRAEEQAYQPIKPDPGHNGAGGHHHDRRAESDAVGLDE